MTSDTQSNKARDVVLLIGLVFFVLSGLAIEVVSCETTSSCVDCGCHRTERIRYWFVWGSQGSNLTESTQPSRFLKDFPEFKCDHHWSDGAQTDQKIWDSPLIGLGHTRAMTRIWSSCCLGGSGQPVWERYETDEAYRDSIQELLETGAATRERLIALANESRYPGEEACSPEDEAILKILYPDPYGCPAKTFKPLELPILEDFIQSNERPPI